jgi:hypothetical protein
MWAIIFLNTACIVIEGDTPSINDASLHELLAERVTSYMKVNKHCCRWKYRPAQALKEAVNCVLQITRDYFQPGGDTFDGGSGVSQISVRSASDESDGHCGAAGERESRQGRVPNVSWEESASISF